jgi:hypothetical protein
MPSTQQAIQPANHVMALFHDRAQSFSLSVGATLGDLADRIGQLEQRYSGMPRAVSVKFGVAKPTVPVMQPWM